jgi:hypothetical protein
MEAVRCTRCGETRWSLFASSAKKSLELPCEVCGGPTVPERRRPGAGPGVLPAERRNRLRTAGALVGWDTRRDAAGRPGQMRQVVH